ncbi:hypothetical protein HDU98_003249 [Podochytrium sp. JEL0797]|nr:hypothetical protein HDU98_003249 [Podochytrium sp. JEL0797]
MGPKKKSSGHGGHRKGAGRPNAPLPAGQTTLNPANLTGSVKSSSNNKRKDAPTSPSAFIPAMSKVARDSAAVDPIVAESADVLHGQPYAPFVTRTSEDVEFVGRRSQFIKGDGNCLFSALSSHLNQGDPSMGPVLRKTTVDNFKKRREIFEPLARIEGMSLDELCAKFATDKEFGEECCIASFCDAYSVEVSVFTRYSNGQYAKTVYTPRVSSASWSKFRLHLDVDSCHYEIVSDPVDTFCKDINNDLNSAGDDEDGENDDGEDDDSSDDEADDPAQPRKRFSDRTDPNAIYIQDLCSRLREGEIWVRPPNAAVSLERAVLSGKEFSPKYFLYGKLGICNPYLTCGGAHVCCPQCKRNETRQSGYSDAPRRVYGSDGSLHYLLAARGLCRDCGYKFRATNTFTISKLPFHYGDLFDHILTKRAGVDGDVVFTLRNGTYYGLGPSGVQALQKQKATYRHSLLERAYYSTVETLLLRLRIQPTALSKKVTDAAAEIPLFPAFRKSDYDGGYPSVGYLSKMFVMDNARRRDWLDFEVQRRNGKVLCIDHHFKVLYLLFDNKVSDVTVQICKHLAPVNGHKMFKALFTGKNEYSEIRLQALLQTAGHFDLIPVFRSFEETRKFFGHDPVEICYTDKCCSDRAFLQSVLEPPASSGSSTTILPLPSHPLAIRILSTENPVEIQTALSRIISHVRALPVEKQLVVGLDTEWNNGPRGKEGPVRLLQLAFKERLLDDENETELILLVALKEGRAWHTYLREIVESPRTLKAGSRIVAADFKHLSEDFGVRARTIASPDVCDLAHLCKRKGKVEKANASLATCCAATLGYCLDKSVETRCSDWSKRSMSKQQKEYAARDAWASLLVCLKLQDAPDTVFSNHLSRAGASVATNSAETTATNESAEADGSASVSPMGSDSSSIYLQDSADGKLLVLEDALHGMQRIEIPKKHPMFGVFYKALRDAMFVVDEVDKVRLDEYLRSQENTTFEKELLRNPDRVLKHVKRRIPVASDLYERLTTLLTEFSKATYKDEKGGDLLSEKAKKDFRTFLNDHVRKGCLSDPEGVPLYTEIGKGSNGLPIYATFRGTSAEFMDAALSQVRHTFNVRASERHRPGFPNIGHYEHYLIDHINEITHRIYGQTTLNPANLTGSVKSSSNNKRKDAPTSPSAFIPAMSKVARDSAAVDPIVAESADVLHGQPYAPFVTRTSEDVEFVGRRSQFIKGDGNCLFSALSWHLNQGDPSMGPVLRKTTVDNFKKRREIFEPLARIEGMSLDELCAKFATDKEFGEECCIASFCDAYSVEVSVFTRYSNGQYAKTVYTPRVSSASWSKFRLHLDVDSCHYEIVSDPVDTFCKDINNDLNSAGDDEDGENDDGEDDDSSDDEADDPARPRKRFSDRTDLNAIYIQDLCSRVRLGEFDAQLREGEIWVRPPNAAVSLERAVLSGKEFSPKYFLYGKLGICNPYLTCGGAHVCCPQCKRNETRQSGYSDAPRRVYGSDGSLHYLLAARGLCRDCGYKFRATNTFTISKLPFHYGDLFDHILTKRAGVDGDVVFTLRNGTYYGLGPSGVQALQKQKATYRHSLLERAYYSTVETLLLRLRIQPTALSKKVTDTAAEIPLFPAFRKSDYDGGYPSVGYLSKMFVMDNARRRDWLDFEVQRRNGKVLCIDHHFKICKHLAPVNGHKMFKALFTGKNEYSEIRLQALLQTAGHFDLIPVFRSFEETRKFFGHDPAEICYTDKCCSDRAFLQSFLEPPASSVSSTTILPLPSHPLAIRILSTENPVEIQTALSRIISHVRALPVEKQLVVGLDTEWNNGPRGKEGPVRLLQLAFKERLLDDENETELILLVALKEGRAWPTYLREIVESPRTLKAGSRIVAADFKHLSEDFGVRARTIASPDVCDLAHLCKRKGKVEKANASLATCCVATLGYCLDKSVETRCSDWSKRSMSKQQKEYAARDAWASLLVCLKLQDAPDIVFSNHLSRAGASVATNSAETTATNESAEADGSASVSPMGSDSSSIYLQDSADGKLLVLEDALHGMQRIEIPKKHPMFGVFYKALRDAMFAVDEVDKVRLDEYLRSQENTTFEKELLRNPDRVLKHVKRRIPVASDLYERLTTLLTEFSKATYKDEKGGDLLSEKAKKDFRTFLNDHVRKGCLSDPEGVPLYTEIGKGSNGLPIYATFRGTSAEFMDAALSQVRHTFNVRASERHRPGFPNIGHYEHYLIDHINEITHRIYGQTTLNPANLTGSVKSSSNNKRKDAPTSPSAFIPAMSKVARDSAAVDPIVAESADVLHGQPYAPFVTRTSEDVEFVGRRSQFIKGDGNCLFSALSWHLNQGDPSMGPVLRKTTVDNFKKRREIFEPLARIEGMSLDELCAKFATDKEFGEECCIASFCDAYSVEVSVFTRYSNGQYAKTVYTPRVSSASWSKFRLHLDVDSCHYEIVSDPVDTFCKDINNDLNSAGDDEDGENDDGEDDDSSDDEADDPARPRKRFSDRTDLNAIYIQDLCSRVRLGEFDAQLREGEIWVHPPNAAVSLERAVLSGKEFSPKYFLYGKLGICNPYLTCGGAHVCCPQCKRNETRQSGYSDAPRRVYGSDGSLHYLLAARGLCRDCGYKFRATNTFTISKLPFHYGDLFDQILTKRAGVDGDVVFTLRNGTYYGLGPSGVQALQKQKATYRHSLLERAYYSTVETLLLRLRIQPTALSKKVTDAAAEIPLFPAFRKSDYDGGYPSVGYLSKMFVMDNARRRDWLDFEVQRRNGKVLCIDHHFKVLYLLFDNKVSDVTVQICKHLAPVNGHKMFKALFTGKNEYSEIRLQALLQTAGHFDLIPVFRSFEETRKFFGHDPVEICYTDKCCSNRAFLQSVLEPPASSGSSTTILPLPSHPLAIRILSTENPVEIQTALSRIISHVRALPVEKQLVVGLDTEWNNGPRGKEGPVRLLQLAFKERLLDDENETELILLVALKEGRAWPTYLREIVESPRTLKAGSRIVAADFKHLSEDFGVCARTIASPDVCDLAHLCKRKGKVEKANASLATCCAATLGYCLDKSVETRCSDWSKRSMSKQQKEYAARDAWASLLVCLKLQDAPDIVFSNHLSRAGASVATNSAETTATNESAEADGSASVSPMGSNSSSIYLQDSADGKLLVLEDALHGMQRIEIPKKHPMFGVFYKALRDAMFVVNEVDKVRLDEYLRSQENTTFEKELLRNPDRVLKHVKRRIPVASDLYERLTTLLTEFSKATYKDEKGGDLLSEKAKKDFRTFLNDHVRKGCLSDPEGVPLYTEIGKGSNGLPIYATFRGTSAEFMDAALSQVRHTFNVRASERHRPGFPNIGHYEHYLIDHINEITHRIYEFVVCKKFESHLEDAYKF